MKQFARKCECLITNFDCDNLRSNIQGSKWFSIKKVLNMDFALIPKKSNGYEITRACKEYISNLIQGEDYPSYDNGFPQYTKLECKTIKKKLPAYKS